MAAERVLVAGKAHFECRVHDLDAEDAGLLAQPRDYLAQARQVALQHRVFKRELKQLVHLLGSGGAILLELEAVAFNENGEKNQRTQEHPGPEAEKKLVGEPPGHTRELHVCPLRLPSRACYYDTFRRLALPLPAWCGAWDIWPHLVPAG